MSVKSQMMSRDDWFTVAAHYAFLIACVSGLALAAWFHFGLAVLFAALFTLIAAMQVAVTAVDGVLRDILERLS